LSSQAFTKSILRVIFLVVLSVLLFHISFALRARARQEYPPPSLARVGQIAFRSETPPPTLLAVKVSPKGKVGLLDSRSGKIQVFFPDGGFLYETPTQLAAEDELIRPLDFAFGADEEVIVADTGNQRIVQFGTDGSIKTLGTPGVYNGQFVMPVSVVAMADHFYVLDTALCRIQQYSGEGVFVGKTGQKGVEAGTFQMPVALVQGNDGSLMVVDSLRSSISVYDFLLHYEHQQILSAKDRKFKLARGAFAGAGLLFLLSKESQEILVVYRNSVVALLTPKSMGVSTAFWTDIAGSDNRIFILDARNQVVDIFELS
jgi:hypothetical protein